jgi:hypothetical protein
MWSVTAGVSNCELGPRTLSMTRGCSEVLRVRPGLEDVDDLGDDALQLALGVEEVRPEADPGVGTEVAEDLASRELCMHGRELRDLDGDRAAAT